MLVNARVAVIGVLPGLPQEPSLPPQPPAAPRGERRIYLGDWINVPVYDFDALAPGQAIAGPAIVEFRDDHGAAAPRRPCDRHPARLAGHRGALTKRGRS